TGRLAEAAGEFRQAGELSRADGEVCNAAAWFLATCPEPRFRDPGGAVTLAKKAVQRRGDTGNFWNTLGGAHYGTGDWRAALSALKKSVELRQGGDSFDFFFLAMAHWQLGEKEKARAYFDRAVRWMEQNKPRDEELCRFRAEAAGLLGVKDQPLTKGKEVSPRKK